MAPVPPENWIPDVTMLHRMMLAGQDTEGRPWPPSLDSELCEDIGTDGSNIDISKEREYSKNLAVSVLPYCLMRLLWSSLNLSASKNPTSSITLISIGKDTQDHVYDILHGKESCHFYSSNA
jgi:hypothetical protein